MTQRLALLTQKNLDFHKKMSEIRNKKADIDQVGESKSLLIHPFANPGSVFFGKRDMESNAFVELTPDQLTEDSYLFDLEGDDCANLVFVNNL
jgi:hypothetical protein